MAHDARHEQSKRERCGEILEILKTRGAQFQAFDVEIDRERNGVLV